MGKFDIQDEYNFRLTEIARLIALCGEDETQAETITVDELMALLGGHYYPEGMPSEGVKTDAQKQLHRVWYRSKDQARVNCYYRDVLKARMI